MSTKDESEYTYELLASVDKLSKGLPAMLEYQQYAAMLIRARYEALLSQGFTDVQAMIIVKDMYK
jgi:hypothetical protein